MLPVPVVRSCLGTSPGLKAFGLAVTLPAGPIFPDTGEAVVIAKNISYFWFRLTLFSNLAPRWFILVSAFNLEILETYIELPVQSIDSSPVLYWKEGFLGVFSMSSPSDPV